MSGAKMNTHSWLSAVPPTKSGGDTASRVDGGAVDGDPDEVHERQAKTNNEARHSGVACSSSYRQNDKNEGEGQNDLDAKRARRIGKDHGTLPVAVHAEALDLNAVDGGGREYAEEDGGAGNAANHLRDPKRHRINDGDLAGDKKTHRDGRVDVAAGNGAQGVDQYEDDQTEYRPRWPPLRLTCWSP